MSIAVESTDGNTHSAGTRGFSFSKGAFCSLEQGPYAPSGGPSLMQQVRALHQGWRVGYEDTPPERASAPCATPRQADAASQSASH